MPDRLDVLTGSCMQIPCSFDIPHQNKYTFNSTILTSGVWIKESPQFHGRLDSVVFNSSETVNRYQGKINGNMSQKNCTTVFFNVTTSFSDKYFFRIESQPFRATDPDKSVDIAVRDLPSSPILTVSGEVKEGTFVSINCSAVAHCPEHSPELTWTLPTQFTPEKQLQENPYLTKSVLSTVTFTPSYLHHEKNITCTAVYPVGARNKTAKHNMMLNVSFSPKDTSASMVHGVMNIPFTIWQSSGRIWVLTDSRRTLPAPMHSANCEVWWMRNNGPKEHGNSMDLGIAAGTLGAFLLISLISLFGWRRNSRLHHGLEMMDCPQGQNSPVGTACSNQATAREEPEEPAEDQPEEIHYGDIDFSKLRTKETPAAAQDRVQGQESEYAEDNVTGRGNQEPPLNNLDGLYAQVNKRGAC